MFIENLNTSAKRLQKTPIYSMINDTINASSKMNNNSIPYTIGGCPSSRYAKILQIRRKVKIL